MHYFKRCLSNQIYYIINRKNELLMIFNINRTIVVKFYEKFIVMDFSILIKKTFPDISIAVTGLLFHIIVKKFD